MLPEVFSEARGQMDAHQSAYIDKHVIILEANAQSLNYTPKMHLFMKSLCFFLVERIMLSEGVLRAVLSALLVIITVTSEGAIVGFY